MIAVQIFRAGKHWLACAPDATAGIYRGRTCTEALGNLLAALADDLGVRIFAHMNDKQRHVITPLPAARWMVELACDSAPDYCLRLAAKIRRLIAPLYPPAGHTSGDRQS